MTLKFTKDQNPARAAFNAVNPVYVAISDVQNELEATYERIRELEADRDAALSSINGLEADVAELREVKETLAERPRCPIYEGALKLIADRAQAIYRGSKSSEDFDYFHATARLAEWAKQFVS